MLVQTLPDPAASTLQLRLRVPSLLWSLSPAKSNPAASMQGRHHISGNVSLPNRRSIRDYGPLWSKSCAGCCSARLLNEPSCKSAHFQPSNAAVYLWLSSPAGQCRTFPFFSSFSGLSFGQGQHKLLHLHLARSICSVMELIQQDVSCWTCDSLVKGWESTSL